MTINGQSYDWESTTITLPSGIVVSAKDIEHDGELPKEGVFGRGTLPQNFGVGQYVSTWKLTLDKTEFALIKDYAIGIGRGLLKLPAFPIVIQYANDDQPVTTDVLPQCTIDKSSESKAAGDTEHPVELEGSNFAPRTMDGLPDVVEI